MLRVDSLRVDPHHCVMNTDPLVELACHRLVIEFAAAVDSQQYERLRDLFTPTARFARPTDPHTLIEGIDNIVAAFKSRPSNRITQHLCTNLVVTQEAAARASGRCAILLFTADTADAELPGKGRKTSGQLVGAYADVYVLGADGWRIAERHGRVTLHV
jgi:hypothetical protein